VFDGLEQLDAKKSYWGFLESRDAWLYLSLRKSDEPVSVDASALLLKLAGLLPSDPQLDRRKRKLAWQVHKGRKIRCQWDFVTLSELTRTETEMSEPEFIAIYTDHVEITASRKRGRPVIYRTEEERKRAHSDRQREYQARKDRAKADLTKNPELPLAA
jgi:hypothetical protein